MWRAKIRAISCGFWPDARAVAGIRRLRPHHALPIRVLETWWPAYWRIWDDGDAAAADTEATMVERAHFRSMRVFCRYDVMY